MTGITRRRFYPTSNLSVSEYLGIRYLISNNLPFGKLPGNLVHFDLQYSHIVMKIHPLLNDPKAVLVSQTPLSGAVTWQNYHRAALDALSLMQIVLEGEKAAIKPNVTSGERFVDPDNGITTHPGFVHGIIDYLQAHGARPGKITIIEDPRDSDDNLPRNWRGTGYERVAETTGAKLHCPTTYTCVKKKVPQPKVFPELNVSRLAVDLGTILINVPKLKTHNLSITSLCMKNLMGLVNVFDRHYCLQAWLEMPPEIKDETRPRREWFTQEMHELWQDGLARRLVDTAQAVPPALNIIEGVVGREGTGFQRGQNRALGLAIAGINLVSVDALACYLMGFDLQRIVYLRQAAQAGLGVIDIDQLKVYTARDGELALCRDVKSLRISPPFRVIKNIVEEEPGLFQAELMAGQDSSGSLFGKSIA